MFTKKPDEKNSFDGEKKSFVKLLEMQQTRFKKGIEGIEGGHPLLHEAEKIGQILVDTQEMSPTGCIGEAFMESLRTENRTEVWELIEDKWIIEQLTSLAKANGTEVNDMDSSLDKKNISYRRFVSLHRNNRLRRLTIAITIIMSLALGVCCFFRPISSKTFILGCKRISGEEVLRMSWLCMGAPCMMCFDVYLHGLTPLRIIRVMPGLFHLSLSVSLLEKGVEESGIYFSIFLVGCYMLKQIWDDLSGMWDGFIHLLCCESGQDWPESRQDWPESRQDLANKIFEQGNSLELGSTYELPPGIFPRREGGE